MLVVVGIDRGGMNSVEFKGSAEWIFIFALRFSATHGSDGVISGGTWLW